MIWLRLFFKPMFAFQEYMPHISRPPPPPSSPLLLSLFSLCCICVSRCVSSLVAHLCFYGEWETLSLIFIKDNFIWFLFMFVRFVERATELNFVFLYLFRSANVPILVKFLAKCVCVCICVCARILSKQTERERFASVMKCFPVLQLSLSL